MTSSGLAECTCAAAMTYKTMIVCVYMYMLLFIVKMMVDMLHCQPTTELHRGGGTDMVRNKALLQVIHQFTSTNSSLGL